MGELASLASSAAWAVASLSFAKVGKEISGSTMNLLKCVLALLLFLPTLVILEGFSLPASMTHRTLALLALSGFVGMSIGDTAYFASLARLGARRSLIFSALVPPTTTLLGWLYLGESVSVLATVGIALTIGGVLWVVLERTGPESEPGAGKAELQGIALGTISAVAQSSGSILTKLAAAEGSALVISIVRLLVGILGLVVITVVSRRTSELVIPFRNRTTFLHLFVATFLGTYLGVWLMNIGLLNAPVGISSTLNSTSPIFILPLAWLVLREKITTRAVFGAVIAVVGIGLIFARG